MVQTGACCSLLPIPWHMEYGVSLLHNNVGSAWTTSQCSAIESSCLWRIHHWKWLFVFLIPSKIPLMFFYMCHISSLKRHLTALEQTLANMETVWSQPSHAFLWWCVALKALLIAFRLSFWQVANCVVNLWRWVPLDCGLPILGLSFTLLIWNNLHSHLRDVYLGGGLFLSS